MLIGKCSKCGNVFFGWSLSKPEYQKCPGCGADLTIYDDNSDSVVDKKALELLKKEYQSNGQHSGRFFV